MKNSSNTTDTNVNSQNQRLETNRKQSTVRGHNPIHFSCDQNWTALPILCSRYRRRMTVHQYTTGNQIYSWQKWIESYVRVALQLFISSIKSQERIIKHECANELFSTSGLYHWSETADIGCLTRTAGPSGPGISEHTTKQVKLCFKSRTLSFSICPCVITSFLSLLQPSVWQLIFLPVFLCWFLSNKHIAVWCSSCSDCLSRHNPSL